MHYYALILVIIASTVNRCFSIQCYTCDGNSDTLDNKTCSVITQKDSCYTIIDHSLFSGKWIISMGAFNNNNSDANFPDNYVKPKSGSSFFDQYWLITAFPDNSFQLQTRFFCYEDFCNPLSLVQQFMNSQLKYPGYNFERNVTQCLICNTSDFNSAKQCKQIQTCGCDTCSCAVAAAKHVNDLYNYDSWHSTCVMYPINNGDIRLQFEMDTKLLNVYTQIICLNTICSYFDYVNNFMDGIYVIF